MLDPPATNPGMGALSQLPRHANAHNIYHHMHTVCDSQMFHVSSDQGNDQASSSISTQ